MNRQSQQWTYIDILQQTMTQKRVKKLIAAEERKQSVQFELTLLKKIYVDLNKQNEEIDAARSAQFGKQTQRQEQWWRSNSNLPQTLRKKLNKLESNFLKEDKKLLLKKSTQRQKIKQMKDNQHKISTVFWSLDLESNPSKNQENRHSNSVSKMLNAKLMNLYNTFLTLQRTNVQKRVQLEAKELQINRQNQEIQKLEAELQKKKKQYEMQKYEKMTKQQQFKKFGEKMKRILTADQKKS